MFTVIQNGKVSAKAKPLNSQAENSIPDNSAANNGHAGTESITLSSGDLAVIPATGKQNSVVVQANAKQSPDRLPFVLVLALNCILVLAGLGIAAAMVKVLAKRNDDDN